MLFTAVSGPKHPGKTQCSSSRNLIVDVDKQRGVEDPALMCCRSKAPLLFTPQCSPCPTLPPLDSFCHLLLPLSLPPPLRQIQDP
mmetsp:Transcript_8551/g.17380  ORF Transcript_8551/g.17380 Transcript_8551/m.17380 type:complete len:85 (+) Transcript_8551:227-481(+)